MGTQGLEVGRAWQAWEIAEGRYVLRSRLETSGLAAWLRPVRLESESRGTLTAQGLQPEHYQVRKRDGSIQEVHFDWQAGQVRIAARAPELLQRGSQDLLSLHYQLALLPDLENGVSFFVATERKYERYQFDSLGETRLSLLAGDFRVLHLQSLDSSRTEIWLALDHQRLPVKIRHTDKKGEVFEQVLTRLSLEAAASP